MSNNLNGNIKAFEELVYSDDFMFGRTMQDTELCHDVIECLIQEPVGELSEPQGQKSFRFTSDGKPIRLDIYTKDDTTVYDAEMQNLGHRSIESLDLPKRTRFYQASIDMDHIDRGQLYKTLPQSRILFICTFDPFGKGLSRYTFRQRCDECAELELKDGTEKYFYNCSYKGDDIPEDLRRLYDYVETGVPTDDLTRRIEKAVAEDRRNEKWRSDYMKERVLFMDFKEEGREEGREDVLINMIKSGKFSDEDMASCAECSIEHVMELRTRINSGYRR